MQSSKEQQGEIRRLSYVNNAVEKKENNRMEKTRENWRYLGNISCKYRHNKGQNCQGPNRSRRD